MGVVLKLGGGVLRVHSLSGPGGCAGTGCVGSLSTVRPRDFTLSEATVRIGSTVSDAGIGIYG